MNYFGLLMFYIDFVKAGPCCGWRWTNCCTGGCCEMNWFDPEPEEGSSEHEEYMSVLKYCRNDVDFFKGFHGPHTEEELGELVREKNSLYSQLQGSVYNINHWIKSPNLSPSNEVRQTPTT